MFNSEMQIAARLAIAALIGLAAGLEREWSGHTSGPDARFAGLRTFFLLGLVGGIAGVLGANSNPVLAGAIALGGAALCVSAYAMTVRRPGTGTDGTTEAAALTVVGLGAIAGAGWIGVAAGAGAVVVLMLREKERLHWLVRHLQEPELRAGFQFAVLAVVVLPLLPTGPYLGVLDFRPRALWMIVLVFSALNFAGFAARRIVGASRGLGITGALGGIVSSTAVTLSFSRQSRSETQLGAPLARGVIAACTMLIPRILVVSAAFNPAVALQALPLLAPPFVLGLGLSAFGWRSDQETAAATPADGVKNPLHLGAALRMGVAFQVAMVLITLVQRAWGTTGVYTTAAVLGLTDMDALTVSMSRPESNVASGTAARAIAIGILMNTFLKLTLAVGLGRLTFRRRAAVGLVSLAAASAVGLLIA
ncbi:MAG TPA: DUF4010 domain-containing protein [Gemmatimonadaceae bacterium]